jgi:hypothetical protein
MEVWDRAEEGAAGVADQGDENFGSTGIGIL